jgi:ADP-ribosylglycohydrolase
MRRTRWFQPDRLADRQLDRAAGVLLGAACGDALGVPYEFGPPLPDDQLPQMTGGGLGPYAPGEYSDDTQMAACIAEVAAAGADLRTEPAQDAIAERFLTWRRTGATDIGAQTSAVLSGPSNPARPAASLRAKAAELHTRTGRTAGNGSLMRTGVIALAYLDDIEALATAARAVSDLTHADPLAGDACVLWCAGIRHAVLHGTFDGIREGLWLLPRQRRGTWMSWLDDAEQLPPRHFTPNGYVVTALQAAWSAIVHTPPPTQDPGSGTFACQHYKRALGAAVRIGNDTDTVAAIAGALLGARWGASAIPLHWQRRIHGWPNLRAHDLIRLAITTMRGGTPPTPSTIPATARPFTVAHPFDDGVLLGSLHHTGQPPTGIDAVVSLCRTPRPDQSVIAPHDWVQVWLIDQIGHNQHPHHTIDQAARAIAELRAEHKRVLLHCAAGHSRTAAVAVRYAALRTTASTDHAFDVIEHALEGNGINPELRQAVYELAGQTGPYPKLRGKPDRPWLNDA